MAINASSIGFSSTFLPQPKKLSIQKISQLGDWFLMALSAQTGYIMPQKYEIYRVRPGDKTNT